ncbi:hypothetical protein C7M52_00719 [Mixta theicola]|nr:hypothetical protein [Mixta theicola]QHM74776.1 hypothetical protein C7M52_00719 [Mixta theicola]
MYDELKDDINAAFKTDEFICFEKNNTNANCDFLLPFVSSENDKPKGKILWSEVLEKENDILDSIFSWYECDICFHYLFPTILQHCLENNFSDDDVLMCLMDRFSPSFFEYGDCSYFNEFSNLSKLQRDVVKDFLLLLESKNTSFQESCTSALSALDWLNSRDKLIEIISFNFSKENLFLIEDITSEQEKEGDFLRHSLFNINWSELATKNNLLLASVIDDYPLLSNKAFLYFIPACMIATLYDFFDENSNIPFNTIHNICYANQRNLKDKFIFEKFNIFSLDQKKAVQAFLELILKTGRSEKFDRRKIMISLMEFWAK